ncbi:MAG: AtpZ/AtpI family protein [Mariniblastus sp.]|nr:AtpZ/AtpI family protein [Mariniblastus sp.]
MEPTSDTRSPAAKGMHLASQVTTISLMMVLPAAGGYYADAYFGTLPLLMIVGLILGLVAGVWQLTKLAQDEPPNTAQLPSENRSDDS